MINDDLSKKKSPHFREKYLVLSYLKALGSEFNLYINTIGNTKRTSEQEYINRREGFDHCPR